MLLRIVEPGTKQGRGVARHRCNAFFASMVSWTITASIPIGLVCGIVLFCFHKQKPKRKYILDKHRQELLASAAWQE